MATALRPLAPGSLDRFIKPHAPLQFAAVAVPYTPSSALSNAAFKPPGEGPFPTVLVVPSCGGVANPALRERVAEIVGAGYLTLVLDSFEPRGQKNCRSNVITNPLVWRDATDALAHLQKLPGVDVNRIYQVGYSMGAFAAAVLASPSVMAYFESPYRFRATVGWYGSCGEHPRPESRASQWLRADTDRPVLLLMADADRETPLQPFCFPVMEELKAAGKPVFWHIYGNGTTHAWDNRKGYVLEANGWGERVENRYDPEATLDATQRTLAFLKAN